MKAGAILSAGAFWWPGAPAITAASLLTDGETILETDSAATRATYADPALKVDKDSALLAFKAGPGLPSLTDTGTGGSADEAALDLLLADPHFLSLAPKSAKPEAFAAYFDHLETLALENAEATALAATALSLVTGLVLLP